MDNSLFESYLVQRINPVSTLAELEAFPSFFEIETVHDCNARCRMCPALKNGRPKQCMSNILFEKIIQEIAPHSAHVRRVNLFRDGEPLLDPQLEERVALCKTVGIPCVSITSNMSLTTEERAEKLLRAGLDMIDMSIDGFSAKVFEDIRKGLKYRDVVENALRFIAIRDGLHAKCAIRVRMVLQTSNQHEWDAFSTFWTQHLGPGDTVMNHPIHNWGNQLQGFTPVKKSAQQHVPCVALWSLMPIFADGTVPLCNVDYDASEVMGNVQQESIKHIWTNSNMQHWRYIHFSGHKENKTLCTSCNAWDEPSYIK